MKDKYLIKFADCIPVKGDNRSTICDLTRNTFDFIPNDMFDFLDTNNKLSLEKIMSKYNETDKVIVSEYLEFLEKKEYIFYGAKDEIECFPDIEIKFEKPYKLLTAIIEMSDDLSIIESAVNQIIPLGVKYIQLRSLTNIKIEVLDKILSLFLESSIERIEIFIPFSENQTKEQFETLIDKHLRISTINIFAAPFSEDILRWRSKLLFSEKEITSHSLFSCSRCKTFRINVEFFTEANFFNVYFNNKVSISKNGDIKNCLSFDKSFGNIKSDKISNIIKKANFTELWYATKDITAECKTCEFRFICFDSSDVFYNGSDYERAEKCNHKL